MSHAILNIASAIAGMDLIADPGSQGIVSREKKCGIAHGLTCMIQPYMAISEHLQMVKAIDGYSLLYQSPPLHICTMQLFPAQAGIDCLEPTMAMQKKMHTKMKTKDHHTPCTMNRQ